MGPGNTDVSIPARHRGTVTTLIGEAPEPEPGTTVCAPFTSSASPQARGCSAGGVVSLRTSSIVSRVITSRDNTCSSAANRSRS
ncbi:hypothetical protein [Microbispora rosea]